MDMLKFHVIMILIKNVMYFLRLILKLLSLCERHVLVFEVVEIVILYYVLNKLIETIVIVSSKLTNIF